MFCSAMPGSRGSGDKDEMVKLIDVGDRFSAKANDVANMAHRDRSNFGSQRTGSRDIERLLA